MKKKQRLLKILILLIICCLIYFIYKYTIDDRKISYVSLGDGYATGINSYNQVDYGYAKYIEEYLRNKKKLKYHYNEFNYKNAMIKDIYKDILINKHDNNNISVRRALRDSELLTLSIGLNDLIYLNSLNNYMNNQNEIVKDIILDLDSLIEEIKRYYKKEIYIVGYYNFYPQNSVERNLLDNLNNEYKKYSKRKNIIYIEINKNLQKYYENTDNIYPNSLGYQEIYKNIIDKIKIN